jgi:hypothetical protein
MIHAARGVMELFPARCADEANLTGGRQSEKTQIAEQKHKDVLLEAAQPRGDARQEIKSPDKVLSVVSRTANMLVNAAAGQLRLSSYISPHLCMMIQACFGALIGVMFAIAIARILFPPDGPPSSMPAGLLDWNIHNVLLEPREKGFYLLCLFLGPIGSILATRRLFGSRIAHAMLLVVLIIAIPLLNATALHTLQGSLSAWVTIVISCILGVTYGSALLIYGEVVIFLPYFSKIPPKRRRILFVLMFLLLASVIFPSSFTAVAVKVGLEMHVASFLIGPALYHLGHDMLPGVDYYAQYGLGFGWLFSFFLASNAEDTIIRYVAFIVIMTFLFFTHLLYLLQWLYRSSLAAGAVTFLALIFLFHTSRQFFDPSSGVLRYPLLTVCGMLLARWVVVPADWKRALSLSSALAVSLFLETETGIISAIGISGAFLGAVGLRFFSLVRLASVAAITAALLGLLVLAVFGPRALTVEFFREWLKPLTIYGVAGFGAVPIQWTLSEWNWLYNLVIPGIALATPAVVYREVYQRVIDPARAALLLFFAICGTLMMAKFINMSLVALWEVNSLGFLIVFGWWCSTFVQELPQHYKLGPLPLRVLASAGLLLIGSIVALTTTDQRNPDLYSVWAWETYPALLTAPLQSQDECRVVDCMANRPDPLDIALIDQRIPAGKPAAIIGDIFDWSFLVGAHRPPLLSFIPSGDIFTEDQLNSSLKRMQVADYWFIAKRPDGTLNITPIVLRDATMSMLEQDFVFDGEGSQLTAWKRRQ